MVINSQRPNIHDYSAFNLVYKGWAVLWAENNQVSKLSCIVQSPHVHLVEGIRR